MVKKINGPSTKKRDNKYHTPLQNVGRTGVDLYKNIAESIQFEKELKKMINIHYNSPSIVVWVPFNEGMGQFQSKEITHWTMKYDPTRLVNGISGWQDRGVGHFIDLHQYPGPGMEPPSQNQGRAVVLGEFGGYGLPVKNHMCCLLYTSPSPRD